MPIQLNKVFCKQKLSVLLKTSLVSLLFIKASLSYGELVSAEEAPMAPLANLQFPLVVEANLTDKTKSLADFKGKILLVDFWASWCGPCRASFPWMNKMRAKYQDQDFEVVAINVDLRPELAFKFLTEIPADFPVLLDEDAKLPDPFNVMGMPTSYLLDKQGRVRGQHVGFQDAKLAQYEADIQALLAE